MKKGKVFGKSQITVAVMLIALGAAVWLNAKYLPSQSKYLGEASYVSSTSDENAVQTSLSANDSADYFKTAKQEREKNRNEIVETVEETLKNSKLTVEEKKEALQTLQKITDRSEKESNIESLLKAKGFNKVLAVIGDDSVNIVLQIKEIDSAKTLQIQDIVTQESGISVEKIKIIPVTK